jgi:hypothetical protein
MVVSMLFLAGLPVVLSAAPPATGTLERDWRLSTTLGIRDDLHHVQGIDVDGGMLWISSVDAPARKGYLTKVELASGRTISQVEIQDGKRIHPGGIALDGDSIWVPVAEYHRGGPSWIERHDKRTLKLVSRFEVADHIGCVAASDRELVGGSWASRTIYRWKKDGSQISRLANPIATEWQDLKIAGRKLFASGPASKTEGAIEWLSLPEFLLERRVTTGTTDRGVLFTQEGMTIRGNRLYLLPEDAPTRLFVFVPRK